MLYLSIQNYFTSCGFEIFFERKAFSHCQTLLSQVRIQPQNRLLSGRRKKALFVSPSPDTALKRAKGIYEAPKKFRAEKAGEISRNLRFLLIFFCGVDGSDQNSLHLNTSIQNGFIMIISTLDQKLKPIFGFGAFL